MDMKVAPFHRDLYDIGYVSGGKAETGSVSSTDMVGIGGYRLGGSKGGSKGGGGGGVSEV